LNPIHSEAYKWECLKTFQDNWDIDAENFLEMYYSSFYHEKVVKLWKDHFYLPKEIMMEFIKIDAKRCQNMFKDLYNESVDVEKRIRLFISHCDDLLLELQKTKSKADNHFHADHRMISVYLSFRYPEMYSIFSYYEFRDFMKKMNASDIPRENEIGRFFKLMRVYHTLLKKDEEILNLIGAKIDQHKSYLSPTTLLAHDFYWCCTKKEFAMDNY
jgi:hypothetical protein